MDDTLARLRAGLAGRYEIEREVGAGGMATVYLARDVRHNRPVAIKVLNSQLLAAGSSRRFLTEVHVTANLQHPNILPLHDSGEAGGLVYYVMPFVDGESLRVRLAREGPLPLSQALPLLEEVADALACAHELGVVHRDIKPENILLSRGHALVADFGIAKAIDLPDDMMTKTGEGLAVGTPAYMAPEQAMGQTGIGPGADLYALGLLAFEVTTGRHPFDATTPAGLIAAHLSRPAPRLATRIKDCPPALDDLVARLLAKKPEDRPASAAQVRQTLHDIGSGTARRPRGKLTALLVGVMVVVAAFLWSRGRSGAGTSAAPAAAESRSLAVLPLTRIGGDSTDDYFGDGIADELISTLGRLPGLRVASRTSSFALRGRTGDVREIGEQLNVQTVLEGSIQRSQNRVRVIVRLVDVASDAQLWTGTYDGTASDVFAMQDSVVRAIAGALRFTLTSGPGAVIGARAIRDTVAHDLYLRGRYFLSRRTPASLDLAVRSFSSAIARDSGYAMAWAGLAAAYGLSAPFAGRPPHEVFPLAQEAVRRALALDSTAAEAHMARAFIATFYEWDWATAGAEFQRSLTLNPNDAETRLFYCWYLVTRGRMREARAQIETAAVLDPLSVIIAARVGSLAWFDNRPADAVTHFLRALELDSTFFVVRAELPAALLASGRRAEARAALPPPEDVRPGTAESGFPAWTRVALGDTAGARRTLRALESWRGGGYVAPDAISIVYLALGDTVRALDALERAADDHAFTIIFTATYPPFRGLAGNPRYQRLLARIGIPLLQ